MPVMMFFCIYCCVISRENTNMMNHDFIDNSESIFEVKLFATLQSEENEIIFQTASPALNLRLVNQWSGYFIIAIFFLEYETY